MHAARDAVSLVAATERRDWEGGGASNDDGKDPMETASWAYGATLVSVRTGASRRRWHRGGEWEGSTMTPLAAAALRASLQFH